MTEIKFCCTESKYKSRRSSGQVPGEEGVVAEFPESQEKLLPSQSLS